MSPAPAPPITEPPTRASDAPAPELRCGADHAGSPGPAAGPAGERPPLKVAALKVALWRTGGFGASQVLRLASNLVLARLLVPADFGLAALVLVWLQGLEMFSDLGLGPGVVQSRRGEDPEFVNTAWTMGVLRGFCLWLCACALARPVALFYGEPVLAWMMPVAGVTALLGGCTSMTMTLLCRRMKAGYIAFVDIAAQAVGATVMIVWALNSPSVWALVVGGVSASATRVGLSHLLVLVPARLRWEPTARRELFQFGKWVFISTVITFFALQSDKLVGGRLIPLDLFGLYTIAFSLTMMPRQIVNQIAGGAIFPMFAISARTDPAGLAPAFTRARRVLLPLMLVMVLGIVVGGRLFFQLLYPEAYQAAGWMTQAVSAYLWFWILTETADRLLLAVGDSRMLAMANGFRTVVTIAAIIGGYALAGMPGFIGGLALGSLAGYLVIARALHKRGVPLLATDAMYTVILAAAAAAAILLFDLASPEPGPRQIIGAILTPIIPGLWALHRLRNAYRGRGG